MEPSISFPLEVLVWVGLAIFAVIPILVLLVSRRSDWGDGRAHSLSMRAKLPFGSEDTRVSIRARARKVVRANMWGLLTGVLLAGALYTLAPWRSDSFLVSISMLAIILGALTIGSTVVSVRERLFSPAPSAPRVARASALRLRDYLGVWARLFPFALLALAAVAIAVALIQRPADVRVLSAAGVALVFACAVAAVCRLAERRVLASAQPASHSLELAWDDLFRTDTLLNLRMAPAMAACVPLGVALNVLVPAAGSAPPAVLWWGVPFVQIAYVAEAGRLRPRLRPAWLRPAPAVRTGEA